LVTQRAHPLQWREARVRRRYVAWAVAIGAQRGPRVLVVDVGELVQHLLERGDRCGFPRCQRRLGMECLTSTISASPMRPICLP